MSGELLVIALGVATLVAGSALACLRRAPVSLGLMVQAAGIGAIGVVGAVVAARGDAAGAAFSSQLTPAVGVDALSGVFLAALALVAAPALVYACDALAGTAHARATAALTGVFVLALVGVVVARDVVTFLAAWEAMSVAPAATILLLDRRRDVCRTVLIYLALTHLAGAGVWASMVSLAQLDAFTGAGVLARESPATRSLLAAAALIGFGTKAGLMPLHVWLPRAHPVAPSHVSALMSGMMIKVALYGLVRMLFEWLAPVPGWVGPMLLALAALSSVGGVLAALMQHELKRLLAFHSVENVGIICLGLAASLIADHSGHRDVAALALAAALLHTVNHALFKSLLFLCAGSFQKRVGALDLDRMGGLLRTMPLTGAAFAVGAMAIAGVPPFNGFASEWLTLQALLQLALHGAGADVAWGVLAAGALAATAALAVFCFVKVLGLVLLGVHRQHACAEATEVPARMVGAALTLAAACIAIGVAPGGALRLVESASVFGRLPAHLTSATTLSLPGSGTLAPLGLGVALGALVVALQLVRGRAGTAAPAPVWNCGQLPSARLAWTSAGFTKSLRMVLDPVLRPRREIVVERDGVAVRSVRHVSEMPHRLDELLARAVRLTLAAGRRVRRMQSGSLRAYLSYLLVTVVAALALVQWGVR